MKEMNSHEEVMKYIGVVMMAEILDISTVRLIFKKNSNYHWISG
jgi:hypothetical protein